MPQGGVGDLEAAVLGVVQGLTEFLPISSTAHLRVVPTFLGWGDPGVAFSAVIQLGSLIAVLAYFGKDLWQLAAGCLKAIKERDFASQEWKTSLSIVVGTIPICVLGLALKSVLEADASPLRSLMTIGSASLFMGAFLLLAEKKGKRQRDMHSITVLDGLLIGLGQAMALVPGCSRSGSTLTVALLLGFKRDDAARYSFLLGVPAIFLSGVLEFKEMLNHGMTSASTTSLVLGLVTSAVVSYASIWWLIKYLKSNSTALFIVYRFLFGAGVIAASLSGAFK